MSKRLENMQGVGLIEVLVTMLLLSTALLTFASLQTRSLQYNQSAYLRSQANILAYDMLDRIRANKNQISAYQLPLSSISGGAAGTGLAGADILAWRQDVDRRLPSGQAGISCDVGTRVCTVTVQWGEINSAGEAGADNTQFQFLSRIPN